MTSPARLSYRPSLGSVARLSALLLLAAVTLAPFVWMISTSLKAPDEILTTDLHLWPRRLTAAENYSRAFQAVPLGRYLLNGVIVTATILVLQLIIAVPAAFALAKSEFRGKGVLFGAVLFGLLVPYHAIAVPLFVGLHAMGALDTYAALVTPFVISVFGIFLMRQFFQSVPSDLVDAARMDGMSDLAIVWRVMVPAAGPAISAFAIFSVVAHWNDYFWPLVAVSSDALFTPPLGVVAFRNDDAGTNYGVLMAAATVIVLPLVAAFLLAQRRFVEGMAFTGVK